MRLMLIVFLFIISGCKTDSENIESSIINKFGKPSEVYAAKSERAIIYEITSFEDYYTKSTGIKGCIDKNTNMLPTLTKENQNIETVLYDQYEWEKPEYKISLFNTSISVTENKYRVKVVIENK